MKLGTLFVVACFGFLFSMLAYAAMPVNAAPVTIGSVTSPEPIVSIGKIEFVAPAPVAVKPASKPAKARKRVCDKRGHTVSVGYAKNVHTVNKSDTGVTVCWTE